MAVVIIIAWLLSFTIFNGMANFEMPKLSAGYATAMTIAVIVIVHLYQGLPK